MPAVKQHTVRFPAEIYDKLVMRAMAQGRSLNKEVVMICKDRLAVADAADAAAIASVPSPSGP